MVPARLAKAAPIRGPLPRSSSAASGFFFWGMMLEPDAKVSAGLQKPNSSLDQSTSSEPSRERWTAQIAAAERKSSAKSRLETASSEFCIGLRKPSSAAIDSRSRSQLSPAAAPEPPGSSELAATTPAKRCASRLNIQKYE